MDTFGHPHTSALKVTERFRRLDFGHMEVNVTIDDPKIYTQPFEELSNETFKWIPNQEMDEQLCVPSEAIEYMKIIGHPGGSASPAN